MIGKIFAVVCVVILILGAGACFLFYYNYERDIGSYYELSNQASTATLKMQYLMTFHDKLAELNLLTGQSAIIFPTPQTSVDEQAKILDSLIERLNKTSLMNESSFEYQQALYQISRNEFCEQEGCMSIGLFRDLYAKNYGLVFYPLVFAMLCLILFCCVFLGMYIEVQSSDSRF
jgi:hypothetical protein